MDNRINIDKYIGKSIEKKAYAKINIALDVLRKRDDGYHDMKMIMQTLDIFDIIKIQVTDTCKINIISNEKITENIENNLIYKACVSVLKVTNLLNKVGLEVFVEKNIPMGAGMAGGSADCATTILAINELLELGLSTEEMINIGKKLGSDVPYCILGGTKLVEGVGDIITNLNNHPDVHILLAKPKQHISTKEIFESLDLNNIKERPNFDNLISGINNQDIYKIANNFCNVFEEITIPRCDEIQKIKEILNNNGAINSLMTGTGSTVFAYFDNIDTACVAKDIVEKSFNLELLVITRLICNI